MNEEILIAFINKFCTTCGDVIIHGYVVPKDYFKRPSAWTGDKETACSHCFRRSRGAF